MSDTRFRLIFEGLDPGAQLRKLVIFFRKELGLSEEKIRSLLTNPPRVLWEVSTTNDGELIQTALEKIGCRTSLEPVKADSSYPFVISKKHHELMNKELSKILRTRANLVLFLAQVVTQEPESVLPSMMGPLENQIGGRFRESDTVIAIDDSRLIVLGFSTDRNGVGHLRNKATRVFKELLGNEIRISTGYSLFPEESRSIQGLIRLAELKRKKGRSPGLPDAHTAGPQGKSAPCLSASDEAKSNRPLQRCLARARGRIFKRLADLDPQVLWVGLSQLPQTEEWEFLARLPFDSPLVATLGEMIDAQCQPISDKAAEHHLEAIIRQIELEEGLDERKGTQQEVLSKLNRLETLPTLPSIAAHIFRIASNPNSSADDLTKVIENDPPLTSKLLKIVNSAFYGFPQKIGAVKQVVVILGTEEIIDLSFGLAAAKVFEASLLEGPYDPKTLWHHSMGTALIAQNLCKKFPEHQKSGAFTAGLLHDFGKIFLMENFPQHYAQIHADIAKHNLPLFELEEERLGLNHAAIGKFLASNWNLPDALVQAIAFHHQPFSASDHSQLAAIIGLADYLHYQAKDSPEEESLFPLQLTFGHWNILTQLFKGLDTEELKKMAQDAVAILEDSQDLFAILD